MAPLLKYRGKAPVVIEGYSTDGAAAERLIRSRQYAALVRSYLIGRFDLIPSSVAVMPLGRDAAGSPEGNTWEGVAVAMFVEKSTLDSEARQNQKR